MKQILLILAAVVLVGCGTTSKLVSPAECNVDKFGIILAISDGRPFSGRLGIYDKSNQTYSGSFNVSRGQIDGAEIFHKNGSPFFVVQFGAPLDFEKIDNSSDFPKEYIEGSNFQILNEKGVEIWNGGATTPIHSSIPRALNRWRGDASHIVSPGNSSVKPKQGRFMMKMQPVEDRRFSRFEQIVDVSHLVPAEGGAVDFSASMFYDGTEHKSKMLFVLRAFTMSSEEIDGSTEKLEDQVTCDARKAFTIPPGSTDWHTGNLRMDLPKNTKTLIFAIVAKDLPNTSKNASQYVDDVKAVIVANPSKIQK